MVFFSSNRKGYGFGPMPGISRKKKNTIGMGNWDRDIKPNRRDCDPFDFKKQDGGYNEITGIKNRAIERCNKCHARKYSGKCPNCDDDYMEEDY